MKNYLYLLLLFVFVLSCIPVRSQSTFIKDTVYNPNFILSDHGFFIDGYVRGVDSGSLRLNIKKINYSVPIKNGKFCVYGISDTIQKVEYMVAGDYYLNSFFVEPGKITINCDLVNRKYRASGTKENNAKNHFYDSLIHNLNLSIHDLNSRVAVFLESQNIDAYLNTIDSFSIIQKGYIKAIEYAISKELFGYYLLDAINLFPIRYTLFPERKLLYSSLPNYLRSSPMGKESYAYLLKTENEVPKNMYASPQLSLYDSTGRAFDLSKYYGKKIIVLDFWASWCIPCIKALPMIKKIQQLDMSKNVQFISISIDKNKDDWMKMEKRLKIPWISLITDSISVKNNNITAVPAYLIIDKQKKMKSAGSSIADLYNSIKSASQK